MPSMSRDNVVVAARNPHNARVLEIDHDEPYAPDTRRYCDDDDDVPTNALVRAFVVILIMLIVVGGGVALLLWFLLETLLFVLNRL